MNKINVGVVFGGKSVEHDISIITGVQILNNLDKNRFNIYPIYIAKDGNFYFSNNFFNIDTFTKNNFLKDKKCFLINFNLSNKAIYKKIGAFNKKIANIEFVYLATHGGIGENGGLQGFFDVLNINYSSCGVFQSAVGMNKNFIKLFIKSKKIPFVEDITIKEDEKINLDKIDALGLPLIVKPCSLGSSVGISYCTNKKQVKNAVSFAKLFDRNIIIEKAVENLKEVNIAVLGNEYEQEFSDIEEVIKTDDILSFENKYLTEKYSKGIENTKRILPANLGEDVKKEIEDIAVKIFRELDCKGIIRFDFLINSKTNEIFLNEFNTIPGSMANYLWKSKNYNFKTILNKIFDYCCVSFEKEKIKVKNFQSSVLDNIANKSGLITNKLYK